MPKYFISFKVQPMDFEPTSTVFIKDTNKCIDIAPLSPVDKNTPSKCLNYERGIKPGLIIDKFSQFYIISSFDEARFFVPEINEIKQLLITIAYGLKAGNQGISAALALRIFIYHLLVESRLKDAKKLLKLCPYNLGANIAANIGDPIDLLAIAMDKECNYLDAKCGIYYSDLIKHLLEQDKRLDLILEFARFFKAHKKACDKEGALKLIKKALNV